ELTAVAALSEKTADTEEVDEFVDVKNVNAVAVDAEVNHDTTVETVHTRPQSTDNTATNNATQ
ncbi:MAG: hypothetical protein Q7S52_05600, partial [bacterium]|nr:hypothetical protein [bacterium]